MIVLFLGIVSEDGIALSVGKNESVILYILIILLVFLINWNLSHCIACQNDKNDYLQFLLSYEGKEEI